MEEYCTVLLQVWGIVEEYYLLKQEQGGEAGLGKRRHEDGEEEEESEMAVKRKRWDFRHQLPSLAQSLARARALLDHYRNTS